MRPCWNSPPLQALDATLPGASLRDVAEGLFGVDAAAGWTATAACAQTPRRLVRDGERRGGYRRLAQLRRFEGSF